MPTLNSQQQDIVDWLPKGGSLNVVARAGCGKTYTLMELVKAIREQDLGTIALMAYNKSAANEFESRLKTLGFTDFRVVTSGTVHSFGWGAWRYAAKGCRINGNKVWDIVHSLEDPAKSNLYAVQGSTINHLVSLAKQSAVGFLWEINDTSRWLELINHFGLETNGDTDQVIQAAIKVLQLSIQQDRIVVDFDDMILAPLIHNCTMFEKDFVLLDEAQDTNASRRALAFKMLKPVTGRLVAVGDDRQCQPIGTLVQKVITKRVGGTIGPEINEVPIESLNEGDLVVSYLPADSAFRKNGFRVEKVLRRPYKGQLISFRTQSNRVSKYTPNHKCFVNFEALRSTFAVYLMRKGNQYRVGKAKMDYATSSGVVHRMYEEMADALWVLDVYETEDEAYFQEQAIAGRFGIPQLMFSAKKLMRGPSKEYLPKAWKFIGDNSSRGEECLNYFGRNAKLPLFVKDYSCQQSIKRPMITYAANLMHGCSMLTYIGESHTDESHWEVGIVSREDYEGEVVSLDVEKSHLYIADGIVTHNSIYGFTGADSDAMNIIQHELGSTVLSLSVTYRCPKAVVLEANRLVPDLVAHESAPDGIVRAIPEVTITPADKEGEMPIAIPWFISEKLAAGDAVLCRNTKPLIEQAYKMLAAGLGCRVEGRDIGNGLIQLTKRWSRITQLPALIERLEHYKAEETQKWLAKGLESRAQTVEDKCDTLIILAQALVEKGQLKVADLITFINGLFGDTPEGQTPNVPILSTVHKAKGREWDRVFLLKRRETMPSKWARKEWQLHQESNLEYVAITRAKKELIDVA